MATHTLKRLLDLKLWQQVNPSPVIGGINMVMDGSNGPDQTCYFVTSATVVWSYDPDMDGWTLLPSPALATFGAGSAARWHPGGPTGTAAAGSTSTTLNTVTTVLANLNSRNGLAFKVRITGGTGAGQERDIASATYGANSVITVASAWTVAPDATSTYTLLTGRVYVYGGGIPAAGSFKYWDYCTQSWGANLSTTGLPTFTNDTRLVCPNSVSSATRFTGTATGGSATTLVNTAKTWTASQFANGWQVRITAGTGAGGVRAITANTSTTLTIASGTALDATSVYSIEPSDNFIFALGGAAVTLYRYDITLNTWTTVTPGAARAAVTGAGVSAHWVHGVTQADWGNESAVKNCNRIYSFRGGGNVLDYYDIAANTWVSGVAYGRINEALAAAGTGYAYDGGDYIYVLPAAASVGNPTRVVRLNLRAPALEAFSTNIFPATNTGNAGDRAWMAQYHDGTGTPLQFLYSLQHGGTVMHRIMVW